VFARESDETANGEDEGWNNLSYISKSLEYAHQIDEDCTTGVDPAG